MVPGSSPGVRLCTYLYWMSWSLPSLSSPAFPGLVGWLHSLTACLLSSSLWSPELLGTCIFFELLCPYIIENRLALCSFFLDWNQYPDCIYQHWNTDWNSSQQNITGICRYLKLKRNYSEFYYKFVAGAFYNHSCVELCQNISKKQKKSIIFLKLRHAFTEGCCQ